MGFTQISSVYVSTGEMSMIAVYVYDIVLAGKSNRENVRS